MTKHLLWKEYYEKHPDGLQSISYVKQINRLEKQDLLILDDFGLKGLDNINRHSFMEIIENRHGKKPTIIASQLPVEAWHEIIGEQTIADAILDRLIHTAHRINIRGKSMRKNRKINSKFSHNGIDFENLVWYAHFHPVYVVHFDGSSSYLGKHQPV